MKPFIYGITPLPTSTFHIYLPQPSTYATIFSGEHEPIRIPLISGYYSRLERRYLKPRGHRHGLKPVSHRRSTQQQESF